MAGERRCPSCGSDVVATRNAQGQWRCPACHAPLAVTPRSTAAPRAPRAPVLAPLQARQPRRSGGGQAALVGLVVLLLVAGGTLIVIAHPWDSNLFVAGSTGSKHPANVQGRLPGGRPIAPPVDADGNYHRDYSWSYGGTDWTFTLNIPKADYDEFHNAERPTRLIERDGTLYRQMAYDVFVTTPLDDSYMAELAKDLHTAAQGKGWGDDETLAFALSFVQSLPYATDDVTTGFDEYPRYPLETLVDNGGDCEDTAILYASIVQALGYGAVLVSPPGHMAVGVRSETGTGGTSYLFQGVHYLYAETTGDTWDIGEAPDEYRGEEAQIFDLVPKPLFSLQVTYGPIVSGMQEVTLNATAIGSAAAGGIQLIADLTSGAQSFDAKTCSFVSVAPGDFAFCKLKLDLRKVPRGQEVEILSKVQDPAFIYARQDSEPWVPRP